MRKNTPNKPLEGHSGVKNAVLAEKRPLRVLLCSGDWLALSIPSLNQMVLTSKMAA